MRKRLDRSTSVAMADFPVAPMMRLPSVAGDCSSVGGGWPHRDGRHGVDEPGRACVRVASRFAGNPAAAQVAGEFAFEFAAGVDVDRLVDRFGAHAHLRGVGEVLDQAVLIC